MPKVILYPNIDDLIQRYEAGTPLHKLAGELGVSRSSLGNAFKKRGVHLRGVAEASHERYAGLSTEARREQTSAANEAARGRRQPLAERVLRAKTYALNLSRRGACEDALAGLLRERGLIVHQQVAVGPYNLDIADKTLRLAVEVQTNSPSGLRHKDFRQRTEHLLREGWFVLFISLRSTKTYPVDMIAVADQVVAYANSLRIGKPLRGKYGVVGRHGKSVPFFRREMNGLPLVESP